MKRITLTLIIAVSLVLLVRTFAFTSCIIPSDGMENTLYRGDRVLVNKWSYGLRLPFTSLIGYYRWASDGVQRGDIVLFNNPAPVDVTESIDQREVYISRCIGQPGDTLMLNHERVATSDSIISPDDKFLYSYPGEQEDLMLEALKNVGLVDNQLVGYDNGAYVRSFSHYELYLLKQELQGAVIFKALQTDTTEGVHPFVIPAKGQLVKAYPWNAKLLCNTINLHEGRHATLKGNTLVVDGTPVKGFRFTKDYCWVAASNSINVTDSRLFGLVPADHLIGRASLIWFSRDPAQPWNKGFRWERIGSKL